VVRVSSRRVGLSVVVLVALCATVSAWSAPTSTGGARALQSTVQSTGTLLTVRFPRGACAQQRLSASVTVTDRQRRPLARVRVTLRGGSRISPAFGVTAATGKVTLRILPVPFRRGPVVLTVTATPTDRVAVTKQLTLPGC
jgi:hypothetical protein